MTLPAAAISAATGPAPPSAVRDAGATRRGARTGGGAAARDGRGGRWNGTVQRPGGRGIGPARHAVVVGLGQLGLAGADTPPGAGRWRRRTYQRLHPPATGADVDEALVGRHAEVTAAHVGVAGPADHGRARRQRHRPAGVDATRPPQNGGHSVG